MIPKRFFKEKQQLLENHNFENAIVYILLLTVWNQKSFIYDILETHRSNEAAQENEPAFRCA